jgi:DNA polymerase III alpha subunit
VVEPCAKHSRIVLIAMNERGFGNLLSLASIAYEDVANGGPSLVAGNTQPKS